MATTTKKTFDRVYRINRNSKAKGKTGILGGNRFVNPVNPVKISLHCVSACKGRTSSWFRVSQWDMMDCGHLTKTGKKQVCTTYLMVYIPESIGHTGVSPAWPITVN